MRICPRFRAGAGELPSPFRVSDVCANRLVPGRSFFLLRRRRSRGTRGERGKPGFAEKIAERRRVRGGRTVFARHGLRVFARFLKYLGRLPPPHVELENRGTKPILHASKDDATDRVVGAVFCASVSSKTIKATSLQ
ncbi:MAG: hypothetical protein BLITH_1217 [Brockia lithotrophica]|uniref:Uncharacterized protein n=1 Tax=Brockia lithotrophica TaxID=933949 RepID=A0A2T5G487_9BACL|nr:MAG: hypothetical protein BLITH_1217 [Brockia lithotrophica]